MSTLLAENSSSNNLIDASGQQPSQDASVGHDSRLGMVANSSSGSSNLYVPSTSALNQGSSAEDSVFSVFFGHNRDPNSRSTAMEGQQHNTSPSKGLPEPTLDLTQSSLSDIGDGEVLYYTNCTNIVWYLKYCKCVLVVYITVHLHSVLEKKILINARMFTYIQYRSKVSYHLSSRFSRDESLVSRDESLVSRDESHLARRESKFSL